MSAIALTLESPLRQRGEGRQKRKGPAVQKAAAKHSLIVGLGASGAATARYLAARGERVRIIDSRAAPPGR